MSVATRVADYLADLPPVRSRSPLSIFVGLALALLVALALTLVLPSASAGVALDRGSLSLDVAGVTAPYAFDLVGWEVGALGQGAGARAQAALTVPALGEAERLEIVREHFTAVAETSRWRSQLEAPGGRGGAGRSAFDTADLAQPLAVAERRRAELSPLAAEIIAGQISAHLASEGIARLPLQPAWRFAFPPLTFTITPPVLFRFDHLPLLLVVAPRERIAVLESVFLRPALPLAEREHIEAQIDRHGVASLVLPIGGLAAYPSMIPDSSAPRQTLQVVAHEWVHQYLAMRPLGQRYFAGYALRSINETVADLAGKEVGEAIWQRYYAEHWPTPAAASGAATASQRSPPAFDFGQAMAGVRRTVEAMLASGDVAGAEQYMAERKKWLEEKGYYLRKLNTAYLTFYGAYAGSGNSYEPKLRRLRAESRSLADFLHRVETITSESDLAASTGD